MNDQINKGGEGSGKKGHTTPQQMLAMKLAQKSPNAVKPANNTPLHVQHLDKLKNGAVWEGKKTSSGKPVFHDLEHARAHGYTPQDHREVGNLHYDHAKKMNEGIEQRRARGAEVPKELHDIAKLHAKAHKSHFSAAEKLEERERGLEAAIQSKKVKKSIVGMGYIDSPEVDTSKFATEQALASQHPLMSALMSGMDNYSMGDAPREFPLDSGKLYLVKVDDGLYSGRFLKSGEGMEDTAHVRLERMTLPTLINFLMAKEYLGPAPKSEVQPEQVIALNSKLSEELVEPEVKIKTDLEQRITILQLIDKLVN